MSVLDTHDGWLRLGGQLDLPADPWDRWVIDAGQDAILVLYSSSRPRVGVHDKGVVNDELVVALPASALEPGARLALEGRPAHYQQGGAVLTFETVVVAGALEIRHWDGQRLAGTVHVHAREPRLDLTQAGTAQATITFDVATRAR